MINIVKIVTYINIINAICGTLGIGIESYGLIWVSCLNGSHVLVPNISDI